MEVLGLLIKINPGKQKEEKDIREIPHKLASWFIKLIKIDLII